MKSQKSLLLTRLMLSFFAFALLSCSGGGSSTSQDLSNRITVLTSDTGILTPTGEQDQYILTFNNVLPDIVWYTDRPSRDTGVYSMETFILSTWPAVYGDENPNALLQFNMPSTQITEGCFLEIKNPEYDSSNEILTFDATMLQSTLDNEITAPLEIDNAVMTVLNNISTQKRASSYVQYCAKATVESTSTTNSRSSSGTYTLTLHQPDSEVFQADHAPSRSSSVMSADSFIEKWDNIFASSLPNASLAGTSDINTLELYLLTLSNPVYNASNNSITYTATPLFDEYSEYPQLTSAVLLIDAGIGIPAIESKGNKMYYSNSKQTKGKYKRFIPRGVAYQPDDNVDPISDDKYETIKDSLLPMLKDLSINSIRVYQVKADLTHDKVMGLLADNNIYVFVGLADGSGCAIDRNNPQWTSSLYDCMSKKIDTFQKYDNVLAFSVGNEVWISADTNDIASALKAAVRDMKAYIKGKGYRQIPVGMVSRDAPPTTFDNIQYSACQYGAVTDSNPDNTADFIGYNMERWNSPDKSFKAYDSLINLITDKQFDIPVIFTECGVPYNLYYPTPGQSFRDWSQMKYIDTDAQFPTTPSTNNIFPNISGAFAFRLLDRADGSHWGLNNSNDYSLTSHIPLGGYDDLKAKYADASKKHYMEIPPTPTTQRPSCPPDYIAPKPSPSQPSGKKITITVILNSTPADPTLNTAVNYIPGSGKDRNIFIKNMKTGDSKVITIPKESTALIPGWIKGKDFSPWINICGDSPKITLTGASGTANVGWHSCSFTPN